MKTNRKISLAALLKALGAILFLTSSVTAALLFSSIGFAQQATDGLTIQLKGTLAVPVSQGADTTGLALYAAKDGNLIAELDVSKLSPEDRKNATALVAGFCDTSAQLVQVTGAFVIENLGLARPKAKVFLVQNITLVGKPVRITKPDGCPQATGHQAFLDLKVALPASLTGTDRDGEKCNISTEVAEDAISVTVGGSRNLTCTFKDNDPSLSESTTKYQDQNFITSGTCTLIIMHGMKMVGVQNEKTPMAGVVGCTVPDLK